MIESSGTEGKPTPAASPSSESSASAQATPAPDATASAKNSAEPQNEAGPLKAEDQQADARPATGGKLLRFAAAGRRLRPSKRSVRFASQAALIALFAGGGAMLGAVGHAAMERLVRDGGDVRAAMMEEARTLKTELAQLRAQIKSANDQVAALRTSVANANAASNTQFAKVSEALDRIDRRAAHAPSSEITGSLVRPQTPAPPKPIPGWTVRRVLNGVALIEGRDGLIEAEPGDSLPGLGRVQDIRREGGRWVVVTSKGLLTSR